MNILAIGAHPDDIEFGCAGTLVKYREKGAAIYLLVLTDGSSGGDIEARREEQLNSANLIGATDLFWGNYKDTKIPLNNGLIVKVEHYMKKVKPDMIFTNYLEDTHQDHRNLTNSVVAATRYTKNVLLYEGPTTVNFNPYVFVDITEVFKEKIECLKAHASQVDRTHIEGLPILEIAKATAHFRGTQGRVKLAEGFQPLRLFINL